LRSTSRRILQLVLLLLLVLLAIAALRIWPQLRAARGGTPPVVDREPPALPAGLGASRPAIPGFSKTSGFRHAEAIVEAGGGFVGVHGAAGTRYRSSRRRSSWWRTARIPPRRSSTRAPCTRTSGTASSAARARSACGKARRPDIPPPGPVPRARGAAPRRAAAPCLRPVAL
jgi:hypothetical protein